MQTITAVFAAIFGLCMGSFANVIIYRLPKGESIVKPGSKCPACGQRLKALDLLPVLSFLLLLGKCRYCGKKISPKYPLVEILCGALFAGTALCGGANLKVVPLCGLAFMLLCVSLIDAKTQEIPDGLIIFGGVLGIIWTAAGLGVPSLGAPSLKDALLGSFFGAAPLFLIDRLSIAITGKDGFGFGDVKLMAVAGLFLGWGLTLFALFAAVVAGGAFGTWLLMTRRAEKGTYMAFAPFLAVGIFLSLWFGDFFLNLIL